MPDCREKFKSTEVLPAFFALIQSHCHFPLIRACSVIEGIDSHRFLGVRNMKTAFFGFREVPREENPSMVNDVFTSVADRYDLMNDLMSFCLHRCWKNFAACLCPTPTYPLEILDLACGSADMSLRLYRTVPRGSNIVMADANLSMLQRGRDRLIDAGHLPTNCVQCDALYLPFPEKAFDLVVIAFGLRNLVCMKTALAGMRRVLRVGGMLLILEFSKPSKAIRKLYDFYSFRIIPKLGKYVAKDEASYRYLVESIRMHPDQETLTGHVVDAGFESVTCTNLSAGIVAVHRGFRLRV